MSYASFDYLWWILASYSVTRLLRTQNHRWWLAVGAAIGLGLMTRYTIGLLILGILAGLLLTPARHYFKSPWFWMGVTLAFLICLPNFLWQFQHDFIWLKWIHSIHARDIGQGRTDYFLLNQFWKITPSVTVPFWLAGLWFLFAKPQGKPWRLLGWMYVVPLLILLALRGRDYYLNPAYPVLFAAGAVQAERWLSTLRPGTATTLRNTTWRAFIICGLITAALTLPIAPPGSSWWRVAASSNAIFNSQFGWPEMVAAIARARDALSAEDRAHLAILVGDDGETGAIDLYGPAYHLPAAISGMNSAWYRGYGDPPPQTILAVNMDPAFLERSFTSCQVAARLPHPWGIVNDTVPTDEIYVCRGLRTPWPQFWAAFHYYG
jgi:4-amino-4-deoxy-L-arabinose transferase-like glycosyltransferase